MNFKVSLSKNLSSVSGIDSSRKNLSFDEQKKYFPLAQKGDRFAMDLLVNANIGFVITLADKFCKSYFLEMDDLINEGCIGLMEAIKRFDISMGNKFTTYAVYWIRLYMTSLVEHSNSIRVPRKANVNMSDYITESLDAPIGNNQESMSLMEVLADDSSSSIDENLNESEMKKDVMAMIKCLDDRERYIVKSYFGFSGKEKSFRVIGNELNISKERVRQIQKNAMKKMFVIAKKNDLDAYVKNVA